MTAVGLLDVAKQIAASGGVYQQRDVPATGEAVVGRIVDVTIMPIGDGAVAMTFVDVTDQRRTDERLRTLAETDAVTGLWNRGRFQAELGALVIQNEPTLIAVLELVDFKRVNDTMGHGLGDLFLKALGDRFTSEAPDNWRIARLGGDEFGVAMTGPADAAVGFAEQILEIVDEPLHIDGIQVRPEATIGIACFPDDGDDVERLLRVADAALFSAKRGGETLRVVGVRERNDADDREQLNKRLIHSFARDEFMLYAQPIVNLKTYEIEGVEGLARWVVPGLGVLSPGAFIDLLAMSGRSTELTDYMVRQAVDLTSGGRFVSINLSPADLHRHDLVSMVQQRIDDRSASTDRPGDLWLEILESRVHAAGHEMIDDLIGSGVQVAIDDFGAAFSSLTRLADHEVSVLKLDRDLLQALGTNSRARRVVRSVVETSHDLGAVVVAEGVETMDAASVVEDLGCDLLQGFLLGRPAPERLIAELMARPGILTPDDWPSMAEIKDFEASVVGIHLD